MYCYALPVDQHQRLKHDLFGYAIAVLCTGCDIDDDGSACMAKEDHEDVIVMATAIHSRVMDNATRNTIGTFLCRLFPWV